MDIDDRIALAKKLIAQREEIDQQLAALLGGEPPEKKERKCSHCGEVGHNSRACPKKANRESAVQ